LLLSGCLVASIPSDVEEERLPKVFPVLDAVVAVEGGENGNAWSFARVLESIHFFRKVEMLEAVEDPDIVMRVEPPSEAPRYWPMYNTFTMGIIPTLACNIWPSVLGWRFSVRPRHHLDRKIVIDAISDTWAWYGTVVPILALFPGISRERAWESPQYKKYLLLKLYESKRSLEDLLERKMQ